MTAPHHQARISAAPKGDLGDEEGAPSDIPILHVTAPDDLSANVRILYGYSPYGTLPVAVDAVLANGGWFSTSSATNINTIGRTGE